MDNKIADRSPFERWHDYCNKIIVLIKKNGDDFPDDKKIENLVKRTTTMFKGSPRIQSYMDRVLDIQYYYEKQKRERNKQEMIKEMPPMEEKKELDDVTKAAIKNVITKIAIENNIKMADKVSVRLSPIDGTILFEGIEA